MKAIKILDHITELAPLLTWTQMPGPEDQDSICYLGQGSGWRVTVCDFSLKAQGFTRGERGHDGAALNQKENLMIRLGHDVGKVIWHIAAARAGKGGQA
jgi:hypothetical protein